MKIILIFVTFSFLFLNAFSREPLPGLRYEALSGIQKVKDEKADPALKKPKKILYQEKTPSPFLAENIDFLPPGAQVLDVDMGDGRNSVFLARKGFKVTGLEESEEAYKNAKIFSKEFGVRIDTILDQTGHHQFPHQSFDVILCFYHVDKKLLEKMKNWLRPNGIIVFEAHTDQELHMPSSERSIKSGELLQLFSGFRILKYEEPLHRKEFTASIIVKKE